MLHNKFGSFWPQLNCHKAGEEVRTHVSVVTAHHLPVGHLQEDTTPSAGATPEWVVEVGWGCCATAHLVADAVAGLVGVVGPVHLAAGLGLRQHRGLLGELLSQGGGRGAGGERGGGGGRRRLVA